MSATKQSNAEREPREHDWDMMDSFVGIFRSLTTMLAAFRPQSFSTPDHWRHESPALVIDDMVRLLDADPDDWPDVLEAIEDRYQAMAKELCQKPKLTCASRETHVPNVPDGLSRNA